MYEFLKKLFAEGAITFEQFCEKLEADKSIKLVNLADGGYVGKDKFQAKETELSGVKQQLADANATIESYKGMDIDGIKKSAAEWEQKHKDDTAALQKQLDDQAKEFAAKTYLGGFQYTDDLVKEAIYAKFMAKNFTLGQDGKFDGADAFMEELKKTYPSSFANPTGGNPAGGDPKGNPGGNSAGGGQGGNPAGGNPPQNRPWFAPQNAPHFAGDKKRTLTEMMQFKNAHPEAKVEYD